MIESPEGDRPPPGANNCHELDEDEASRTTSIEDVMKHVLKVVQDKQEKGMTVTGWRRGRGVAHGILSDSFKMVIKVRLPLIQLGRGPSEPADAE